MNSTKRRFFVLLILLCLILAQSASAFANTTPKVSSNINRPEIKVKTVDESYIKITWKKCSGAASYEVYSSVEKNRGYEKIGTTKKTYFNDKKAIGGVTYYYKVRAISNDGKKCSKYSTKKTGLIDFEPKIILPEGYPMVIGESPVFFPVIVEGTSRELDFWVNDENVLVSIESKKNNSYVVKAQYANPKRDRMHFYSIHFKFKGVATRVYQNLTTLVTIPPTAATEYKGIPLFSTIIEKATRNEVDAIIDDRNSEFYVYSYESIIEAFSNAENEADDSAVDAAINTYIKLLESPTYGYKHDMTDSNKYGGNDYFFVKEKGRAVIISDCPGFTQGPCVMIVVEQ